MAPYLFLHAPAEGLGFINSRRNVRQQSALHTPKPILYTRPKRMGHFISATIRCSGDMNSGSFELKSTTDFLKV